MDGMDNDVLFVDNAGDLENARGDQADDEVHTEDNDYKEDNPDEFYNKLFDEWSDFFLKLLILFTINIWKFFPIFLLWLICGFSTYDKKKRLKNVTLTYKQVYRLVMLNKVGNDKIKI